MKRTIKTTALVLALSLCLCLLPGCGGSERASEAETAAGSGETVKIGMLTAVNLTSGELADALGTGSYAVQLKAAEDGAAYEYDSAFPEAIDGADIDITYYDTLNAMLMALESGEVRAIVISETVADYLCGAYPDLHSAVPVAQNDGKTVPFTVSYSFLTMDENAALRDELNGAIAELTADGTLNRLLGEQVFGVTADDQPAAVVPGSADGAETIRVAVTGDLPPLDYIAADGTPAGFNTALLAEIGSRLGINIELVAVDSGARAAALASGVVDVVFWARSVSSGDGGAELERIDIPDNTALTEPYFTDMVAVTFS